MKKKQLSKPKKLIRRIGAAGLLLQILVSPGTTSAFTLTNGRSVINTLEAKDIIVSGRILDSDGVPLPGVSVTVKGTSNASITDANGRYAISNVPENGVLVFSFIGMKTQEVQVSERTSINVTLEYNAIAMEEAVVVGYGAMKKADVTGAVGSVSAERIAERGTTSVMEALQGNVAGVEIRQNSAKPGSGFNIQIRGQNSLAGGNPLYVVDGIVTSDIDFLNPSDIARIDVLKDASSTAIYGSRGSNGVVIVTTKRAENAKPGKLNLTYDGYFGSRNIAEGRLPEFMDGRDWAEYRAYAYVEFNRATKTFRENMDPGRAIMSHTNGTTGAPVVAPRLYNQEYTDWQSLLQRDGQQQNHYLNASGTANNLSYNFGVGYQNEVGNFVQEYFNRYSIKASLNHKPSKYFQLGATINLSQITGDLGSGQAYSDLDKMAPFFTPYHPDGTVVVQPGAEPNIQSNRGFTGTRSPLATITTSKNERRRGDVLASAYLEVSPIEGLDIRSAFQPRFYRNRIGQFSDIVQDIYLGLIPDPTRSGRTENDEIFEYTLDNTVNYRKVLNEKHNIWATGLFSLYSTRSEGVTYAARNLPYASQWYNLQSGVFDPANSSSAYSESNLLSYMGRINYDYMGKYYLTASLRTDGSSKLRRRWATFPSFALGWRLSEESFLKDIEWVNNLKLRFSYGNSGNNNINPYITQLSPNIGNTVLYNFGSTLWSGFGPGGPVNPNLTWERTRESNLGLDFDIFRNRISGSVELYDKLSSGLLSQRTLAIESGVDKMTDNVGSISNKGIELSLNTVNIKGRNFNWSTSFNFTRNRNAIVELYGKKEDVPGEKRFIGQPINVQFDYRFLGVWTQAEYDAGKTVYSNYTAIPGEAKVADTNGDGRLTPEDRVVLGSSDPTWSGGFMSRMQFKKWDFSFNLYTRQGLLIDDQFARAYLDFNGRSTQKLKNFDYYVPAGTVVPDWGNFVFNTNGQPIDVKYKKTTEEHVGKYPNYFERGGAFYGSNAYYKDPSFVKVKNITLGYTFNQKFLDKMRVNRLRVYANILNPFVFTEYEGYDPEYATTRLNEGNGPSTVTYQFGVNFGL
ncbi:SusC/RagA family TonB-linked outer membrane protein [Pedobacter alpinus]|uniref:SusC/RagA family TonB-linked outer membrane protein n=1 Tax=Pedobacter alpinus TaxID=1590643 RepID=A0ABW5TSA9_9SPHI